MFRVSHKRNKLAVVILLVICICLAVIPAQESRASSVKELDPPFETVMTNVGNYIMSVDTNPGYGSIWNTIGMVRSGKTLSRKYKDTFYKNTVDYLQDNNWQITRAKSRIRSVFPVSGGQRTSPRCPKPIGAIRSTSLISG